MVAMDIKERLFIMAVSLAGYPLAMAWRGLSAIKEPVIMSWAGIIWFSITMVLALRGVTHTRLLGPQASDGQRVSICNAAVFILYLLLYLYFSSMPVPTTPDVPA